MGERAIEKRRDEASRGATIRRARHDTDLGEAGRSFIGMF